MYISVKKFWTHTHTHTHTYIYIYIYICTIGPTFCAVKKEVCRKRNTQTWRQGGKYSSRFYSAMITATRKVPSSPFLSVVTLCVWELAVWHTLITADCTLQTGVWRVGTSGTFNEPVLTTAFNSAKISLLVFLYRDFGEQIEDSRMFDVTSETRDITFVIILKSRLTLQVILLIRANLVTPSLIDDSARP